LTIILKVTPSVLMTAMEVMDMTSHKVAYFIHCIIRL